MAFKVTYILFFEKRKKESKFPLPKPKIKTLIHTTNSKHFANMDVDHLLVLPFSEGEVDGVRDNTEKKYEQVKNIKDYQKEVRDKTHDDNGDVIIAVAAEFNNTMIVMTATLWEEVADVRDDAVVNGKIMKFLGKDDIETANEQLNAAMDVGDDNDKLNNTIKKRVNAKLARREAQAKERA